MGSTLAQAAVPERGDALPGVRAVRAAIQDLSRSFPDRYPRGAEWLKQVEALELRATSAAPAQLVALTAELAAVRNEALRANPLLDFDRLLLVKRAAGQLALPQNWESNSTLPRQGLENELVILRGLRGSPVLEPFYQPEGKRFVGDLSLHFDATRFMFSSIGPNGRWGVFEMSAAGGRPRQLPLIPDADVDNYTSCYLPDDSIIFTSTAPFIGVPCVRGSSHVAHLYRYWPATGRIRRLTFDQEHNWCPTVMPDGRLLYLRWEYADLPHFVARILFTMNPDGTNQREYYGSGSYWPNAFFYAKPMPGSPNKVVGIVGGHHGVPRMGELVIIDPAQGRFEADGVVQRIPGYGKQVAPIILDNLVDNSWPKFLHPAPLSDKYIITACQPSAGAPWGIYLVDVFDNLVLIKAEPGSALLEPIPLRPVARPPVIPDATKEGARNARMQIVDIYQGPGLRGVPRGTIKQLRLFTYNFSYQGIGGQVDRVGLDGPWDIKRIIGTVPVEADGSAHFEVPANMPISLQPLDEQGRAVALMRSWTTAMPGELQSCVGCHEQQSSAPVNQAKGLAMRKEPAQVTPFYGPLRGFHFDREVQPVLDRHCIVCHNGETRADGKSIPDFKRGPLVFAGEREVKFPPAYVALKSYVRNPTAENDMRLLLPYEFHASTTELVQVLEAGHHGVRLDAESWDRLITWIDLNTPAWGTWEEMVTQSVDAAAGAKRMGQQRERRRELTLRYSGTDDDTDAVYPAPDWKPEPRPAEPKQEVAAPPRCAGWPFDAAEAKRRQQNEGATSMKLDLGGDVNLTLIRIPAGRFVAGGASSARVVQIPRTFWMSACEISNAQYARFDPRHDSRIEHGDFLQFSVAQRGHPLSGAQQPVCHVSWDEAQAFCRWLSARSGRTVRLPDGDAWEYACRAGAATPLAYGEIATDFSRLANLADVNLRRPVGHRSDSVPEWRPAVTKVNDGHWVSAPVGSYPANAWGLYDMSGNVWEWTSDVAADGVRRLARGGSWYVRPQRATPDATLAYQPWQKVYDVGFRIIIEEP
ncbi:MAG: SUMF1/EgtB/PvdO family nonheme iron enzyme [Kiritimatiellaeota bacterium]|nr:SUMF1/EgtB/PvdO family nonheme iron enzyme [Kiritimatiellota bacterium]